MSKFNKASVLIVESKNGEVFIVESKESPKSGRKILKKDVGNKNNKNPENIENL